MVLEWLEPLFERMVNGVQYKDRHAANVTISSERLLVEDVEYKPFDEDDGS